MKDVDDSWSPRQAVSLCMFSFALALDGTIADLVHPADQKNAVTDSRVVRHRNDPCVC